MPSLHNWVSLRSRIKTVIESVTDVGQVHDYERFADDWAKLKEFFVATISGSKQLRGWTIALEQVRQEQSAFGVAGDGVVDVFYSVRIRGFMAVSDADATQKTFEELMLDVMEALDQDANLHSASLEGGASGYFSADPVSVARIDFRRFSDVLVHYADLLLEVQEVI